MYMVQTKCPGSNRQAKIPDLTAEYRGFGPLEGVLCNVFASVFSCYRKHPTAFLSLPGKTSDMAALFRSTILKIPLSDRSKKSKNTRVKNPTLKLFAAAPKTNSHTLTKQSSSPLLFGVIPVHVGNMTIAHHYESNIVYLKASVHIQ